MDDVVDRCPECNAGKCGNCDGSSWDNNADRRVKCPCAREGHPGRTA